MPPSIREDRQAKNTIERWCSSCDQWLPRDTRYFICSDGYWFRRCRMCVNRARRSSDSIVLMKVQKHVDWMIGVVGWHETRRRLGVSKGTLHNWVHGKVRRMTKASAEKVFKAALKLRDDIRTGIVEPLKRYAASGHCRGCGTDMLTFTEGCASCWDRQRRRIERASPA